MVIIWGDSEMFFSFFLESTILIGSFCKGLYGPPRGSLRLPKGYISLPKTIRVNYLGLLGGYIPKGYLKAT